MLWLVLFLLGILLGIGLCLLAQFVFAKKWYLTLPVLTPPVRLQTNHFALPKELLTCIQDPELKSKKETCIGLNLLFQFLYGELRDTAKVRRWVIKRMDLEFLELLNTTAGKLLEQIVVRDFRLGDTLPVIKELSVLDVKLKDESFIEEMALLVDLEYHGGFQLAIDVDMMFGKSAYVSVKVTKLIGRARLCLSRIPYTHWSFAFVEEPVLEFDAESQLDGRPIQQLTNLIIGQLRRTVRKKHTLPYYKFRYKPFFTKPEPEVPAPDIISHGRKLSVGNLKVTIVQCSRLLAQPADANLYFTLAIDKMPWTELLASRRNMWISYDLQVTKHQFETIGLTMKDEFMLDRYEQMVIVDSVVPRSSADQASIKKGDLVLSVNGLKVSDTRMAVRVMKQAPNKFKVRVERSNKIKTPPAEPANAEQQPQSPEFQYNEDSLSIKSEKSQPGDEFVNISFKPMENVRDSDKATGSDSDSSQVSYSAETETATATVRRRRKTNPDSISMDANNFRSIQEPEPVGLKPVKSDPALKMNRVSDSSDSTSTMSDGEVDLRRTNMTPAIRDPIFNEEFYFDVEDKHKYLNLCLWCRQPGKLDKQNRPLKQEKDTLMGHVSIPLMNIALECLVTLQGDFLTNYHLSPVQARGNNNNNRAKQYPDLATHKGYDDNLCHGDVTLSFLHSTRSLSKGDRKKLLQIKRKNEENAEQKVREATEKKPEDALRKLSFKNRSIQEGHHRFVSIKFSGATFCNFCHKKIWFKNGYKCEVCALVCHKKCTDKCQQQTLCTESGFKFKDSQSLVESAVKAAKQVKGESVLQATAKAAVKQVKGSEVIQANLKPSFLGRFRRSDKNAERSKEAPEVPPRPDLSALSKSTQETSSTTGAQAVAPQRKRSNSLTDLTPTPDADTTPFNAEGAEAPLQKTRSSNSLDDLKNKSEEDQVTGSDAEMERDMNLVRYYEHQKFTVRSDEQVVTRAKEMGKELFSYLPPNERREKLDAMINKLQREIDTESENRAELTKDEKAATSQRRKQSFKVQIEKSDERVQSLAVLMLHYCAGLQHCMEEIEALKSNMAAAEPETEVNGSSAPTKDIQSDEDAFYESHSTTQSLENSVDQSLAAAQLDIPVFNQSDRCSQAEGESDDSLSEDEEENQALEQLRSEIEQQFIASMDSGKFSVDVQDSIKSEILTDSSLESARGERSGTDPSISLSTVDDVNKLSGDVIDFVANGESDTDIDSSLSRDDGKSMSSTQSRDTSDILRGQENKESC